MHRQVAEVDAIDRDAPLLHVVKPRQQADERGLAGAAPTDDPDHLSRLDLERHVAEDRLIAVVAECHVVEANRPADILPRHRMLGLRDQGRCVEQFQHPLAAGEKARQPGREVRQRAQGGVEHREVGEERDQLAERHLAADHVPPADIPDDQPAEPEDDLHRGGVGGVRMFDPLPPLAEVVAGGMEAVAFSRFLRKGLYHADAGEHAGERRHLLAGGVPEPVVPWIDVLPEDPRAEDHQRHRNEREQRELGIDPDEHRSHADELHDLQQEAAGDLVHEAVQGLAVVGHAADHRPDLMAVVVGDREALQLGHHFVAERCGDARADVGGEATLENADNRKQHAGEGQGQDDDQQRRLEVGRRGRRCIGPPRQDVVHHVLLQLGGREFGHDSQKRQQAEKDRTAGVGTQQLPHTPQDLPLLHAPRAGVVAGRQPEAAGCTTRRIERPGAGIAVAPARQHGQRLAVVGGRVACLLQCPRHLMKPRRHGVGIPHQIDPVAPLADLQGAAPHAGAGPHPVDPIPGHAPQGAAGGGPVGRVVRSDFRHHREVVWRDDQPLPGGSAIQPHVGVDREQNRPVIEPRLIERMPHRGRQRGERHRRDVAWRSALSGRMIRRSCGESGDRGVLGNLETTECVHGIRTALGLGSRSKQLGGDGDARGPAGLRGRHGHRGGAGIRDAVRWQESGRLEGE